MKRKIATTTVDSVRDIGKDILAGATERMPELLSCCENDDPSVVHAAISSLHHIYSKEGSSRSTAPDMKEHRVAYFRILKECLSHSDLRIQVTAFEKGIATVQDMSEKENEFQSASFAILVEGILTLQDLSKALETKIIQTLNDYDDLRFYFFKISATKFKKSLPISSSLMFRILGSLQPWSESNNVRMICNVDFAGPEGTDINQIMVPKVYKRVFSECWMGYLGLKMNSATYKAILEMLHVKVTPFFNNPSSLMDFFCDSYDSGGLISILALNGVFHLIQHHNLDYPLFYPKLYALFDKDILHVKYRSRFFRLAEIFLASSYIPSYLVASFIKKIARIALTAPPSGILMILPFLFNLLRKHPACISLIHRKDVTESCQDPYLFDKVDPNDSNAMQSCLWELDILKKHYVPQIAKMALIFEDSLAKPSYDLEDFFDHSYKTLLSLELESKKVGKDDTDYPIYGGVAKDLAISELISF